jgi:hypothetical protein
MRNHLRLSSGDRLVGSQVMSFDERQSLLGFRGSGSGGFGVGEGLGCGFRVSGLGVKGLGIGCGFRVTGLGVQSSRIT